MWGSKVFSLIFDPQNPWKNGEWCTHTHLLYRHLLILNCVDNCVRTWGDTGHRGHWTGLSSPREVDVRLRAATCLEGLL